MSDAATLKAAIRTAAEADRAALERVASAMGARHEQGYFARCFSEQHSGKRRIFIAGEAGYAQLIWEPLYPPFRRLQIPEIQDLNVVPQFRRQGLGAALVEACEAAARAAGKTEIGIGVGLYARFGAAQRLYVRRGYLPDGAGLCYDDTPVAAGEVRPVDDQLTLKLVKTL
jgi:GNAT superfamily N-acetyltransferase